MEVLPAGPLFHWGTRGGAGHLLFSPRVALFVLVAPIAAYFFNRFRKKEDRMGDRRQTGDLALDVESAHRRRHSVANWLAKAGLQRCRRLAAGAALAALLALSGPAGANDSIANLETGGLVLIKNTDVEMRSEDLYISDKAVRVKYVFMNTSPKDITVTVAFPMPDIAWDAVGDANVDIPAAGPNFLAFTTTVDGKPVKAQVEQKAMDQNGLDRTAYLLGIGVPLDNTRFEATDDALNRLPKAQQDAVVKLGLAAWPDEGASGPHKLSARWTLKTTFFWQQTFPAGRAVAVEHNYTPSLGQAYAFGWGAWGLAPGSPEGAAFLAKKYCVDDAFVAAFKKTRPNDSKLPFGQEFIDYVLVTGANWKAPIGDFRMVIDKGAPANLASFCGTGVRKTGPTTFEVHHTNFTPTSNVSVLILNPNWRFSGGAPAVTAGEKMQACESGAAQKKRLQSAVPIVWRELTVGSAGTNNFLKRYPYLKEYLDGLESGTPVSIAENRAPANKKAGVNLLFVVTSGRMYCGTGGCDFSIYADSGTGYKEAANFLEFPVQARVSRTADGEVSVFLPFVHKHAPNSSDPADGTYFEYTLKGNSLEKTEPHEGC